jgi:hypothetical protein
MEDLFQLEHAPKNDGLDETYEGIRLNSPGIKKKINHAFHHCSLYLDKNYKEELPKKYKFYSRLWELWVCCRILESPFKENLLPNKDKKKGNDGPDFIIKNALNGQDLVLECVCPNYNEENIVDTGKFQHTQEIRENGVSASWPDESYEEYILSRYMNSLTEKLKQLEAYKKINPNSYYVLCVSGVILAQWKGIKYLAHPFNTFPTNSDFEKVFKEELVIMKNNGVELYMPKKFLEKFDGFIYGDYRPFLTYGNSVIHPIYKASLELEEILDKIFNS